VAGREKTEVLSRRLRRLAPWIAALCTASLVGVPDASAQRAAGILIDVEGAVEPALPSGTEMLEGQTLNLAPQSTVTFVHYHKCRFVALRGGSLRLEEAEYWVSGGSVLQVETVSCPHTRRPALARQAETSGIAGAVLRSVAIQPIQSRPAIVISGAAAATVERVEFIHGERVVARVPVIDGRAAWPSGAKPLRQNAQYVARFFRQAATAVDVPVVVSASLKSDGRLPAVFVLE
jgi:hypothetical protein